MLPSIDDILSPPAVDYTRGVHRDQQTAAQTMFPFLDLNLGVPQELHRSRTETFLYWFRMRSRVRPTMSSTVPTRLTRRSLPRPRTWPLAPTQTRQTRMASEPQGRAPVSYTHLTLPTNREV